MNPTPPTPAVDTAITEVQKQAIKSLLIEEAEAARKRYQECNSNANHGVSSGLERAARVIDGLPTPAAAAPCVGVVEGDLKPDTQFVVFAGREDAISVYEFAAADKAVEYLDWASSVLPVARICRVISRDVATAPTSPADLDPVQAQLKQDMVTAALHLGCFIGGGGSGGNAANQMDFLPESQDKAESILAEAAYLYCAHIYDPVAYGDERNALLPTPASAEPESKPDMVTVVDYETGRNYNVPRDSSAAQAFLKDHPEPAPAALTLPSAARLRAMLWVQEAKELGCLSVLFQENRDVPFKNFHDTLHTSLAEGLTEVSIDDPALINAVEAACRALGLGKEN